MAFVQKPPGSKPGSRPDSDTHTHNALRWMTGKLDACPHPAPPDDAGASTYVAAPAQARGGAAVVDKRTSSPWFRSRIRSNLAAGGRQGHKSPMCPRRPPPLALHFPVIVFSLSLPSSLYSGVPHSHACHIPEFSILSTCCCRHSSMTEKTCDCPTQRACSATADRNRRCAKLTNRQSDSCRICHL